MAITAGTPVLASDFINTASADAVPANDAGRVPKLEADGKIASQFTGAGTIVAVAGEAIATNDAVYINTRDVPEVFEPAQDGSSAAVASWETKGANDEYAYVFTSPWTGTIEGFTIMIKSTSSGLYNASQGYTIWNVDAGTHKPTTSSGSGSGSFAGVSGSSRYKCRQFSPTKSVTAGTEYAISFGPSATNANGAELIAATTNSGFFTYKWVSTDAGVNWSTNTDPDVWIQIWGSLREAGKVYKTNVQYHESYRNWAGFAKAGVSAGADVTVNPKASLITHTGFSGLTNNGKVWLDPANNGLLTQTEPSTNWIRHIIGRAVGTTAIMPTRSELQMSMNIVDNAIWRYKGWGILRATAVTSNDEVEAGREMGLASITGSRADFTATSLAITAFPHYFIVPAGGYYHAESTNSLDASASAMY